MSDKQKEALKVVLELYKEGDMSADQVIVLIEGLTENATHFVPYETQRYLLQTK